MAHRTANPTKERFLFTIWIAPWWLAAVQPTVERLRMKFFIWVLYFTFLFLKSSLFKCKQIPLNQHKQLQFVEFFSLEHFINELEGRSGKKQADKFTLEKFRRRLHRSAESAGEDLCGAPTPHHHPPPLTGMQRSEHKVQSQQEENSIQCYTREYIRYSWGFF